MNNESVWFYDWEKQTPIQHIDGHVLVNVLNEYEV